MVMSKWQQGIPESDVPESQLGRAAAAGGVRGLVSTLDIVPRGLSAIRQEATRALGLNDQPYQPWTPFANLAAMMNRGTYQPQTPGEESAAFAGEIIGSSLLPGMGATRAGMGVSQAAARRAAGAETVSALGSIAGGETTERMGLGRTVGTIAGGVAPGGIPLTARAATVPRRTDAARRRIQASQRQGVPITAGEAIGGSTVEILTETLPGGATAKRQFEPMRSERMGQRLREITEGRPAPTPVEAGRTLRAGFEDWASRFRQGGEDRYRAVRDMVPPETVSDPTELRRIVEDVRGQGAFRDITEMPLVRRIAARIDELDDADRAIVYSDLEGLRTHIGRQMSTPQLVAEADQATLDRLYGAITRDMENALSATGQQPALDAFEEATSFWREGRQHMREVLDPVLRRDYPEQAYQAAMSGTKDGATRLQGIRDTLTPDQWDVVRRTVARKLGQVNPGERTVETIGEASEDFNPATFMTNLNKIGTEAQAVLFEGMEDLQDLVTIGTGIRQQAQYMPNLSKTARGMFLGASGLAPVVGGVGAGVAGGPAAGLEAFLSTAAGFGGSAAANYGAQRLMQSPLMLRAMMNPPHWSGYGLAGVAPRVESQR